MNEEYALKYGLNPHQAPASVSRAGGLPFTVLNGRAGMINLYDALNGWQLVRELEAVTGRASAASFKHVSPAGAASAGDNTDRSPLCDAYLRARDADPMSSYGDFVALSQPCDVDSAEALKREVSDGVIAPGYEPAALEILKTKRGGSYCVLSIEPDYQPDPLERRDVFGVTFEQRRNDALIDVSLLANVVSRNKVLPAQATADLLSSLVILKYTQSNSVCYVKDGLSRADRNNAIDLYLTGEPLDPRAFTRQPERLTPDERAEWAATLSGVALGSDAFFPFSDNIERAHRSGVNYVAEPGGSTRDDAVISACDEYGMVLCFTGLRLFTH